MKATKFLLIIWVIAIFVASLECGYQTAYFSSGRFLDPAISADYMDPSPKATDSVQPSTDRFHLLTIEEQAFELPLDPTYPHFDRTFLNDIQHTQDPFSGFYIYKLATTERNPCDGQLYAICIKTDDSS